MEPINNMHPDTIKLKHVLTATTHFSLPLPAMPQKLYVANEVEIP